MRGIEPSIVARPYGLPIYAQVQRRASDSRSTDFQNNFLPAFQQIANDSLREGFPSQVPTDLS